MRLAPGADGTLVARHIRDWLHFDVYTTRAGARASCWRARLSRMSAVLGLFRALLVLVSIVIMALIVYVLTIEKIRSIATLKLIGAPNRLIVRMIITQSLLLTLAGFAGAYLLRELVTRPASRAPWRSGPGDGATFAVMVVGGLLASLMAVWLALRTPPQLALGG